MVLQLNFQFANIVKIGYYSLIDISVFTSLSSENSNISIVVMFSKYKVQRFFRFCIYYPNFV